MIIHNHIHTTANHFGDLLDSTERTEVNNGQKLLYIYSYDVRRTTHVFIQWWTESMEPDRNQASVLRRTVFEFTSYIYSYYICFPTNILFCLGRFARFLIQIPVEQRNAATSPGLLHLNWSNFFLLANELFYIFQELFEILIFHLPNCPS